MIFKRLIAVCVMISMFLSLTGCDYSKEEAGDYSIPVAIRGDKISVANTKFGVNVFREISKEDEEKNIFISPISIYLALAMVYNGADNETKEEMGKVLELSDMDIDELNANIEKTIQNLQDETLGIDLSIANSVWLNEKFEEKGNKFNTDFINQLKNQYSAEISTLIFDEAAVDKINNWTAQKTKDKIKKIVNELNSKEGIMLLLNAVYFKGAWAAEFDENLTKDKKFYLLDGKNKIVKLMSKFDEFSYYENKDIQVVKIYYTFNGASMNIYLPRKNVNFKEFVQNMTAEKLSEYDQNLKNREGEVKLPRFRIEYSKNLNDTFEVLGMGSAFDEYKADFSKIATLVDDSKLSIDKIIHKTYVDVNEKGTEAAAITEVTVEKTTDALEEEKKERPFEMIADRPFLFTIQDDTTNTILFMGATYEP